MVGLGVGGVSGLGLVGVTVDQLNANLLGEGQLDLLAGGGGQLGDALLDRLGVILNLGHSDAPLLRKVLTADAGKGDGLVHAGLDGLGVGNGDGDINLSDNRDIVGSLLLDLLAVVVAITTIAAMSITTITGLADSDHLDVGLLLEADLNSLGGGVLLLLLVRVRADLVVDLLNGLGADSAGHSVAELNINNALDGKVNILADGLEGRGADLGDLSDILDGAVVLGVLIAVVGSGSMVGGGSGGVIRGGLMVGGGLVVAAISGRAMDGVVGGATSHEWQEGKNSKSLKRRKGT